MRTLVLVLASIPAVAFAQASEPSPPSPPPTAPPAEAPAPPPPVSPAEACRARRHELEEQAAHTADLQERARLLQSLPDCAHVADAPPPAEAGTVTPAPGSTVDAATGFAIELQLETSLVQVDTNSALSLPQAGVFLGYRMAGATLGLGLDFGRTSSSSSGGGTSTDSSSTTFLVMPGLRLPITHSADGRTELLARIDAGYGTLSSSASGSMDIPSVGHFRAQAAPAVRYWVARSFGVGASVGLRYDRFSQDTGGASATQSLFGLFSSFHVIGVF